ncbi:MAG: putative bifunctional diguanylate cyclase/phosphodiesterase [Burkholderiales bacterium]
MPMQESLVDINAANDSIRNGLPNADAQRILVVDDEPRLRDSIHDLLSRRGYAVQGCESGIRARALLGSGAFDLVVLDLFLQDISGHDVMDFIAEREIPTAVVVISGDSAIDSAINALRRGAYDFIRKPYEVVELLKTVENALLNRRLEGENRKVAARLQSSEHLHRFLVNSSPDMIYMLDESGRFSFVSDSAARLLGLHRDDILGRHYSDFVWQEDLDRAAYVFNERRTGSRASHNVELRLKQRGRDAGEQVSAHPPIIVELNSMGLYHDLGTHSVRRYLGAYGVARDISDRKKAEQWISYHAYHDVLTGLPNRTLFKDRLSIAMAQASRARNHLALMFLDLDRFKTVNDTLGHVAGDELLRCVASRLQGCLRKGDTLARIGGDEFTLLLPQVANREDAARIAEKILYAVGRPYLIDGNELFVTASIGIAVFPDDGATPDAIVKYADIAMYSVKTGGKNGYKFYSGHMDAGMQQSFFMERDIYRAVERQEFVLHYQPKVNVRTQAVVGVEALVRWNHPLRGLVYPLDFIPLAEETGLITRISERVLDMACSQFGIWKKAGYAPSRMALNLSARDIEQVQFVDTLLGALIKHGLSPQDVEIEVTESTYIRHADAAVSSLRGLSDAGVAITIDDFGTCYSSLSYLKRFPVDVIKIDKSFVAEITAEAPGAPIIAAIIGVAAGLKLGVVAEGVETPIQKRVLETLGCEVMQGFMFSPPLPAAQITPLFTRAFGLPD